MKGKCILLFGFVLVLVLLQAGWAAAADDRIIKRELSENVTVEIHKDVELVYTAAVVSGYPYYYRDYTKITHAAKQYFAPNRYSDYIAQEARKRPWGIGAEHVAALIVDNDHGVPGIYDGEEAQQLREAVKKFAETTEAEVFFESHKQSYEELMDFFVSRINSNYITKLEEFFGVELSKDSSFRVILKPGLYGGHALTIKNDDGSVTYLNVMDPCGSELDCINLLYHETIHNFMSHINEAYFDLIMSYEQNNRHKLIQGYHNEYFPEMLDETIVRAITNIMVYQDGRPDLEQRLMNWYLSDGWRGTDVIYEFIKDEYLPNRDKYPTFKDFFPVLLKMIDSNSLNRVRTGTVGPGQESKSLSRLVFSEAVYAMNDPQVVDFERFIAERYRFGDFLLMVSNDNLPSSRDPNMELRLIRKLVAEERDTIILSAPGLPCLRARIYDTSLLLTDKFGRYSTGYAVRVLEEDRDLINPSAVYTVQFPQDELQADRQISVQLTPEFDELDKLIVPSEVTAEVNVTELPPLVDVSLSGDISISFSDPIEPSSVRPGCLQLIDVKGDRWPFAVVVESDGYLLRIVPLRDFRPNHFYTFLVGNLTSINGNSISPYKLDFITAPLVFASAQHERHRITKLRIKTAFAWEDREFMPEDLKHYANTRDKQFWGDIVLVCNYGDNPVPLNLLDFSESLYFSENRYILLVSPGLPTLRARLTANTTGTGMSILFFANILPEDRDKIDSSAVYTLVLPQNSKYSIVSDKPLKIQNLGK